MNRRLRGFHGFNDSQPPFSRASGGVRVGRASCPSVRASRLNGLPDVRARPTPSGRPRRKMRRSAGGTPTLPETLPAPPRDSSFLKDGRTEEVPVPGTCLPIRALRVICGSSGVGRRRESRIVSESPQRAEPCPRQATNSAGKKKTRAAREPWGDAQRGSRGGKRIAHTSGEIAFAEIF